MDGPSSSWRASCYVGVSGGAAAVASDVASTGAYGDGSGSGLVFRTAAGWPDVAPGPRFAPPCCVLRPYISAQIRQAADQAEEAYLPWQQIRLHLY